MALWKFGHFENRMKSFQQDISKHIWARGLELIGDDEYITD